MVAPLMTDNQIVSIFSSYFKTSSYVCFIKQCLSLNHTDLNFVFSELRLLLMENDSMEEPLIQVLMF